MEKELENIARYIAWALDRNNAYAARIEISKIIEAYAGDPRRLEPFGFKVCSQNDEDGIVQEIFRRLNIKNGRFCEIGVENGLECNSLYLLHKGWTGCWIEGSESHTNFIQQKFASVINRRLHVIKEMVTSENINNLLAQATKDHSQEIDFFSIDIDGNDIYIFESMSCAPKVVCIEYNAKFPGDIAKQQKYEPTKPWGRTDYFGASLKAIAAVAARKNYRLVGTNITGINAFFVRNDLAGDYFCENSTSEYLHNPPRYWLQLDHYRSIGHPADFGPYVDFEDDSIAR